VDRSLVDNWKSYPIPTSQDTLGKYNDLRNEYRVIIKDNMVHVSKTLLDDDRSIIPFKIKKQKEFQMMGRLSATPVDDGYLVGFYRGEWGGHLYWFSKDGEDHYQISDDEIVQFIKHHEKIFAIQGLAHCQLLPTPFVMLS
jgi:hypothetical protein